MAGGRVGPIIQHLRNAMLCKDETGIADGQLLERFVTTGDEAAFEALVRRHGPMVLGVCRRVLCNSHDAEDCFQATFLVLACKAASIWPRQLVGNWLYGVAHTTAVRARVMNAKRSARERQVPAMPEPQAARQDVWADLLPLLDEELARLPDKYRAAVVLCDLEGRARREVARQLRIPEGTLSSRLTTARRMLAKRLARKGLVICGGALASHAGPVSVAASQVRSVVKSALPFATGGLAASASVTALAQGVLKTMFLAKLKTALRVFLTLSMIALPGGILTRGMAETRKAEVQLASVKPVANQGTTSAAQEDLQYLLLRRKPEDYNQIFDSVLDVVGDYFEVAYANRYDGRIETLPVVSGTTSLAHKKNGSEPVAGPVRRRAIAMLIAADDGGFFVHVQVRQEANSDRLAGESNWKPIGSDRKLEQIILRRLFVQDERARSEGQSQRNEKAGRVDAEMPRGLSQATLTLRNMHVDELNAAKRTISVITLSGQPTNFVNLPVAMDARIRTRGGRSFADLKIGMRLILQLTAKDDQLLVVGIRQEDIHAR
jgi:RNA polymerase sigma factor (sigma-70 family)